MKKKLLAILTGAAITATCVSAFAACGGDKGGNSGIEISEQQFKNALAVFSSVDYWQYEYELAIPQEAQYHYDTQKTRCAFDGNNKTVHVEIIQTRSDNIASSTMEMYIVADGKSLTTYSTSALNMENEQLTNPWSKSFSGYDSEALAEEALRAWGEPTGGLLNLPCKTEENGDDKFLSDLYGKLVFDETDNSYCVNVIYNTSDINNLPPANYPFSEGTLEVAFKFIFENGKIKKLTQEYGDLSGILPPGSLDVYYLSVGTTFNFSYDEIPVSLPEEVKSGENG